MREKRVETSKDHLEILRSLTITGKNIAQTIMKTIREDKWKIVCVQNICGTSVFPSNLNNARFVPFFHSKI